MKPIIIDVREPAEYNKDHVEGAINIPPSELMSGTTKLDGYDKQSPVIVYCLSGARSNMSIPLIAAMGFNNITNGINKDHVNQTLGQ